MLENKEITAEVSIRKSTDKSFMTHSVNMVREIKEEQVGGEKIRTVSYANKNQRYERELTHKLLKHTTYRIYIKIKGEEIKSNPFRFR